MKIANRHEGDRSEFLAEFALSTIGMCVKVPRPSDYFLTDFIVHLAKKVAMVSKSGKKWNALELLNIQFAVQVKSDDSDINIEGEEELRLFFRSMVPFFVVIIDKKLSEVRVYTTLHRCLIARTSRERDVILRFAGEPFEQPTDDGIIKLGPAIFKMALSELDDPDLAISDKARRDFMEVMISWCYIESMNLTWRADHQPYIVWPVSYITNRPVVDDPKDFRIAAVFDEEESGRVLESFGKTMQGFCDYFEHAMKNVEEEQVEPLKRYLREIFDKWSHLLK